LQQDAGFVEAEAGVLGHLEDFEAADGVRP
jgi:hypothetical protein